MLLFKCLLHALSCCRVITILFACISSHFYFSTYKPFLNAYNKALKWPSTPKLALVLYNMESKIPEDFESGHG